MCPSLIQIGSKKNCAQTDKQTDRHYENNGHLAVNQHFVGIVLRDVHVFTSVVILESVVFVSGASGLQSWS